MATTLSPAACSSPALEARNLSVPGPAFDENTLLERVEARRTPFIARFLPSLTDVAFLLPLLLLFLRLGGARTLLGDGDTGWHVRTGEWILAHHAIPRADIFSFTRPGAPWYAWEWLWDLGFGYLHLHWGMGAVVLGSLLILCLTSALLFRLVRRRCENGFVAIAVTLLATGGCAIHWLARPHLLTLLFFVVTLHLVERAREGRTRLLGWLVPLTLLWTNVHGGFLVVFLVLGASIGADLMNALLESDGAKRRDFFLATRPWFAIAAACLAVSFINPYGWQLHQHVIQYLSDPYQAEHIGEFQGLDFHSPAVVYFEPLMILSLLGALAEARRRRFYPVFLVLGWLHLALTAQRNLPLYAIAAAPLVARGLVDAVAGARKPGLAAWTSSAAGWFERKTAGLEVTDRIPRVFAASLLPVLVVGAMLLAAKPAGARFTSTYDPKIYPERALPVLLEPATHHIFADDEWGDYLIYHLYPSRKVFIDGRSDFYGDEFGERYLDLMNVKWDWAKTLDKYAIDTIVLSPKFALVGTLKISPEWRVVYDDGVAVVFRRAAAEANKVSLVQNERKGS